MSKKFSKRTTTKRQYKISPKDAQEILRKEFIDSRGNKSNIIYDIKPQKWNAPTIEIENKSKYNKGNN